MSNSIAAAKRRRAGVIEQSPQPVPSSSSSNATSASRLTLPQIIALFDTRISKLENTPLIQYVNEEKNASIAEYVQEMDHKFNILVDEITATKGNSNRECLAQGTANIANGFFFGMGGCPMIAQTLVNLSSGSRARLSGIIAALTILIIIFTC